MGFINLPFSLRKSRAGGYQFAHLLIIFNVKVCLRRKDILVIAGRIVNFSRREVYQITMNFVSSKILLTIASANLFEVMTGDICKRILKSEY